MVHIFNFFWLKYPHTYNIRHTVRRGQNNFCIQNYLKKEEISIRNWENCKNNPWWRNKFLPTHPSDLLFCPPLSQSKLLVFDQNHSDWLPKNWINKQKKGIILGEILLYVAMCIKIMQKSMQTGNISLVGQFHTASFWNINIQWTSHDDLTEKSAKTFFSFYRDCSDPKTREMTKIQNCTLQFDKKTVSVNFRQRACLDWDLGQIFKSIWKSNAWMDPLEFFFYYISFYSIFCRLSCFHRE